MDMARDRKSLSDFQRTDKPHTNGDAAGMTTYGFHRPFPYIGHNNGESESQPVNANPVNTGSVGQ
jgi:hypothetical protein